MTQDPLPGIEPVARRLLGEPNAELSGPRELRYGTHGSLAIDLQRDVFYDHENGGGGGILALVERELRCDRAAAIAWLRQEGLLNGSRAADGNGHGEHTNGEGQRPQVHHRIVATYNYDDESGGPLFQVVRLEPKKFFQRRYGGKHGWINNVDGVRVVPYRLPELLEAVSLGRVVLVVEGEKDVDNLRGLGLVATCNAGGSGKWCSEHSEPLRGADVVLVPDNDEAGWKHINQVGAGLTGIAARIRVLRLPGLREKGDVSDWLAAGGTREQLDALIEVAPHWVAPAASTSDDAARVAANAAEDELLDALAKMRPGVEYARRRKKAAKQLGVPQNSIDAEVENRRATKATEDVRPLYGHWIVEPWPEEADADALLRDIVARFQTHIVISNEGALAIALWLMLSWVHDAVAVHSPILNINSADPECGKSTTMGVLSFLMPRCIATVDISKAALYRSTMRWRPSYCIDEFDSVLAGASTDENKAELRSVINGGHTRGTSVIRCLGEDKIPENFDTFAPKAIGMVGKKMPAATLGRCIVVEMRRRTGKEVIARFCHVDDAGLAELRRRLARWAIDNAEVLRGASPEMPPGFENRRADNWRLQFAIADLAGGDWGYDARKAAAAIERAVDKSSIGMQALADIRKVFDAASAEYMLSLTLVDRLAEDQDAPWAEFSHGQKLTPAKLARILKPYGITSVFLDGPQVPVKGKGYRRADFGDAWEHYLAPEIPSPPA